LADNVSPVSARTSLATAQMSPRRGEGADLLVDVVVLVTAFGAEEAAEVPGDMHRCVGPQGAGEDADQRDPTDVGVGGRLDDLGDERTSGVALEGTAGVAVGRDDRGHVVLERGREGRRDDLEQLGGAQAGR
jgi:hypothetical protein